MSSSTMSLPLLLTTLLLLHFHPSTSHPFRHTTSLYSNTLSSSAPSPAPSPPPPTTFFEVTRPIPHPKTKPCSYLILNHSFASTYGKPPVTAPYTPPFSTCLRSHSSFSKIILEWNATSTGRQFDRIFSIWLDGVELLRSCTAEPRPNGIFWKVEKDITKYHSHLISSNRTLAVYMGNIVDKTYTGIYHANIAIHFYPSETKTRRCHNFADLILPISRPLPLNDGLWFEVENSTDVKRKEIKIPLNVYRAVLEVYVSFHENDEFWYSNYPNDYMLANNITGVPGNGPFREVVVTLDGDAIVGAVWPFTVIHTGGINPLLWRPITAIGSYDLPTYDIELTPQLGTMLDEKRNHTIEFRVTNGVNSWFVSGNLHLWVDKRREKTEAGVVRSDNVSRQQQQLHLETAGNFVGMNGNFTTRGSRIVKTIGWVNSSIGNITTSFKQELRYVNNMMIENNGGMQEVNQKIGVNTSVKRCEVREKKRSQSHVTHEAKRFSLYLYQDVENNGSLYVTNVSLGFEVDMKIGMPGSRRQHYSMTELRNSQDAVGNMVLKNGLVSGGVGATKQSYGFNWGNTVCYNRDVAASNYTIMYDQQSSSECGGRPRGK